MEIKYKFANGEKQIVKIDVSEQMENEIKKHSRMQHARNVMETRRHVPLDDNSEELCDDPIGRILERYDLRDNLKILSKAIKTLEPNQIALIHEHFTLGKSCEDIGLKQGVSRQAIENRLKKIFKRLRKHFE